MERRVSVGCGLDQDSKVVTALRCVRTMVCSRQTPKAQEQQTGQILTDGKGHEYSDISWKIDQCRLSRRGCELIECASAKVCHWLCQC
jgi:hypothetical protein